MSECSGSCSSCGSSHDGCSRKLPERLAKIKHKIMVLSGKGGVGKSTVAASLAVTLAKAGKKVGLLDVDFHGPSQPTLFHLQKFRMGGSNEGMEPAEVAGIKLVSIGLLMENENSAIVWRGPAKISVLTQLLEETNWGEELDYLVLDFPPGTGDEVLSACQLITGDKKAIIVTTPQEVSLADCRKCLDFCRQVGVDVFGIVENMSGFVCPSCSARHELFSSGGGEALSEDSGVPLLAQIPMNPVFLRGCDNGSLADALEHSESVRNEVEKISERLLNP